MLRSTAVLALLLATPAFAWGDNCAFRASREIAVDAAGLKALTVIAAAGDLTIRGEAGLTRATATGTACASSEELLEAIQLTTGEAAGSPAIRVAIPDAAGGWFGNHYAYLDLEVRVPAQLALRVEDSSGDARIQGVAWLDVRDSSGDLEVRAVPGGVRIADSSGDVDAIGTGPVVVDNDSSGDLTFSDVEGDVTVETDSSGDIDFDDVRGTARVSTDSSGDIDFQRVRGDAVVDHDSSGSIYANGIGGDFIVRSDGSGSVGHRDVAGRVDVPDDD